MGKSVHDKSRRVITANTTLRYFIYLLTHLLFIITLLSRDYHFTNGGNWAREKKLAQSPLQWIWDLNPCSLTSNSVCLTTSPYSCHCEQAPLPLLLWHSQTHHRCLQHPSSTTCFLFLFSAAGFSADQGSLLGGGSAWFESSLTSCVSSGKLLSFSAPQFPHLPKEMITDPIS